jgi:hypothetical protein
MPIYYSSTPLAGVNFYQTYMTPPVIGLQQTASKMALGTRVVGNLNTQWLFGQSGTVAIAQNVTTTLDPVTFIVGTGGAVGKSPIAIPANSGAWFEVSGATLNLTALEAEPERHAGESDADYHVRVVAAHAAVGENPDGTKLTVAHVSATGAVPAPAKK